MRHKAKKCTFPFDFFVNELSIRAHICSPLLKRLLITEMLRGHLMQFGTLQPFKRQMWRIDKSESLSYTIQ